jgi:beta-lactamase regulating signal transducer with metallopeptidase domain
MSAPGNLHWIASVAAERLLLSLGMGTLLALVVWLLLRLLPKRDSRTSFAVWFSTLLITALLPFLSFYASHGANRGAAPVITISTSWAVYIVLAWGAIALAGLARVALATWQVHRLHAESAAVEWKLLSPELMALIEEFRRARRLSLLVSRRLDVPTAIGFFKPAIVLPEWLLKETPAEELKYIVLHEMAHLRRRDDWTNLAQQIVRALLFFLPSVWWIERKLALDREMACDDAVLAQSGTPRGYAECLAHVAERSFLRRQLALAQAAVSRVRQLSVRVAKILDPNRQQSTGVWKPAIPVVVVAAGLCAFSASQAPELIGFADDAPTASTLSAQPFAGAHAKLLDANFSGASAAPANEPKVRAWDASLRSNNGPQKTIADKRASRGHRNSVPKPAVARKSNRQTLLAGNQPLQQLMPGYVTMREEFVVVVTQRTQDSAIVQSWQMHVVEISVTSAKPAKQVPRKI